jgi:hypothetical protein
VIEGIPREPAANLSHYSATAFGPRRILGIAPVEEDGSFHIRVPAEIPVTFQLLDEDYVALRTQRAWTWVMGNESRGCIGCHEDRELSPPNKLVAAVIKPPVELTLPPERRRTVDFNNQIAPIIESRCATGGCHVNGGYLPHLAPAQEPSAVYRTLLDQIDGRPDERYVVPGSARESPLVWLLFGEQLSATRTDDGSDIKRMPPHDYLRPRERILLIEWIDLGAQRDSRVTTAGNH